MKKIILSIIAAVCCVTASAAGTLPSTGDGSKESPYQIGTLDNLLWFADYVNSNKNNASACAMLTADITMNANVLDSDGRSNDGPFDAWIPIGGHGVDYKGEFNGNGHTISGLYFKDTSVNNVGLFGKANDGAYIHDLGIKDSYFYGHDHVGGICGDFASGRIENCWSGATVQAYEYDAGGISGSCFTSASIANCYNIGDVSTNVEKGGTQDSRFGGICGSVYSSSATYSIDNCFTLINDESTPEGATNTLPYSGCNKIFGLLVEGCPPSKIHDSYVKNADAFTGGEVCYRLNYGVTDGSQKWFQTLGSDLLPVMDDSHLTVYYGYDDDVLNYSNTTLTITTTKHEQCAATCNAMGYSRDCWEDTKSGRIYTEAACMNELNQAAVISYIPAASDPTYQINATESLTGWTQVVNETYDGVNFGYAAVKVFEDNSDGRSDNYGKDEWVSFKVTEDNPQNARLKWSWTGDKTKMEDARYGRCTLTYKVNDGAETEITLPSTPFEVSPDVYVLNLGDLSKDDVVEFHIKDYANKCQYPCEVTWAVTLEYISEHNLQHTEAKDATCTENGINEYWYCSKCDKHFAVAECTTVMTDWEIPALGHDATHNAQKDATCTENGNIEHWHCKRCGLNYGEQACVNLITSDVELPKIGHKNKEHQGRIESTCLTAGNIEYWYCPDCKTYFTNEACTASTTEITLAALGHAFTYTPYKTSTCTSEGDMEHWHCSRCEKDFNTGEQTASEDCVISGSLTIPCKESDVILVGMDEGRIYDDCHTFTSPTEGEGETVIATVTFCEGAISMKVKGGEETPYSLNETKPLETFFAHTFKLKANQDPNHTTNYYSTFYTSECAYKVPETAKVFVGEVESGGETDVLKLTDVGKIIHQSEAVILRAGTSDITLMPSCNKTVASTENVLEGTDEATTLSANQYALSLGQNGVGFYLWDGKPIGANKAYLTLNGANAKAFTFQFEDGETTGIESLTPAHSEGEGAVYNLNGMRVKDNYKGIVIKNGKKYVVK